MLLDRGLNAFIPSDVSILFGSVLEICVGFGRWFQNLESSLVLTSKVYKLEIVNNIAC